MTHLSREITSDHYNDFHGNFPKSPACTVGQHLSVCQDFPDNRDFKGQINEK